MGLIISSAIVLLWLVHLIYTLLYINTYAVYSVVMHMFIQTYLFTGLFITGHDAMHYSITKNEKLNKFFGYLTAFLFAGMSFKKLSKNHQLHHRYPATDKDPDFSKNQNFFVWISTFLFKYITVSQIIIMAVVFNVFKLFSNELNIFLFWLIPAILSTMQLFYFGTYRPHKLPHNTDMLPHNARTQNKNHLWAMLSCYFFGYHYEHHQDSSISWWQLYKTKLID